jgi:AraC family L-rhamnose operon transcriptional activator RhaR/AraC family L-rhamnose operon regulatory protein RhaS
LNNKDLAQVVELVDRLEIELKAREPGFGFMATAAFMQIIGWLSRCYGRSPSPDGRALLRIGEAISHLERNIHREVNLEELASIAHMSQRSFLRVFQSATGTSPLAWVIAQRINRACHLLRHTDRRVTEVAFDVGFNDSNYFSRQFRKIAGLSPRDYRLRNGVP